MDKGLELKERQIDIDKVYKQAEHDHQQSAVIATKKGRRRFSKNAFGRLERRRDQRDRLNSRKERKNNDY